MTFSIVDTRKYDKEFLFNSAGKYQQEYVSNLKNEKNVILSLGANYALKLALSDFFKNFFNIKSDTAPELKYDIKHEKNGKPKYDFLVLQTSSDTKNMTQKENMTPFFSLSHSEPYSVAAVSEFPIGIDIQKIKYDKTAQQKKTAQTTQKYDTKYDKLAKRFFSPNEVDFLSYFTDEKERTEQFFTLWTLKEAFLKASDKAGKIAMSDFTVEVDFESKNAYTIYENIRYEGKILEPPENDYKLALMWRK